jgi:hypothetical protein
VSYIERKYRPRVVDNTMLRKVSGLKNEGLTRGCINLHNEEFQDLHSLPNIIGAIQSMKMKRAGNVARMGEKCI